MSRFKCLGPVVEHVDKLTKKPVVPVRAGCQADDPSLDAVIEAAEKEVASGKRKPGMHVLVCHCEKKRKFSVCIEPAPQAKA